MTGRGRDGARGARRRRALTGGTRGATALARLLRPALAGPILAGAVLAAPAALLPVSVQAQQGGAVAAQVQALEDEVRRLNGRIQELEHKLNQLAADGGQRINDLDWRVTTIEGGDPSLVGDPTPLGQAGPRPSSSGGGAVAVSEQVALDDAEQALASGDYAGARARLLQFLAQYPDGPLTPEAEHKLGRAQLELGQTREAAQTFLTNVTAYPQARSAPDSLAYLGVALGRLNQVNEACMTLAEVGARYPGSGAVSTAEAERGRLGCK
ncbi:tol-pal system protein YbgF [Albimonas sp. CAU 1670]|uniref:tol-pal system protein YbgF n=1 Tax=Albimonas sp. CAU 1670 TaxID=3032599 RepID=UPI0023DAAEAD|nr:tol-pal system protein YbgF [Albimonas sp. CAU 1670]MDF2233556.1 tol-pal system protein YbgF [Albimonas sp. CAU 1670]